MQLECILIRIGLTNVCSICALQVNVGGLENVLKATKRTPTVNLDMLSVYLDMLSMYLDMLSEPMSHVIVTLL